MAYSNRQNPFGKNNSGYGPDRTIIDTDNLARQNELAVVGRASTSNEPDRRAITNIRIEFIKPNPFQVRKKFHNIDELARSIRVQGFQSVLLARLDPLLGRSGYVQLVYGERRLRAAKEAGLTELPCRIEDLTDTQMREGGLIENLQRENLEPLEEAYAYWQLNRYNNYSFEQMAERLGKPVSYIRGRVGLYESPDDVKELVEDRPNTVTMATEVARLKTPEERAPIIERIRAGTLNTQQVRDVVKVRLSRQGVISGPANSDSSFSQTPQQASPALYFNGNAAVSPAPNLEPRVEAVPRPNYNAQFWLIKTEIAKYQSWLGARPQDTKAILGYLRSLVAQLQIIIDEYKDLE